MGGNGDTGDDRTGEERRAGATPRSTNGTGSGAAGPVTLAPGGEQPTDGVDTYELVDAIEEVRLPVAVERGTAPAPADADERFPAPVDGTWRVEAAAVTPRCTADVYVREPDNAVVATATAESPAAVPPGPHVLELSTAPVKTYLAVCGPARVSYPDRYPRVSFDADGSTSGSGGSADRLRRGEVVLAARSRRASPAGTVRYPAGDPAALARAISTFGSALATTSPERSFPTLRGHPPLLEPHADASAVETPALVSRPDTGVTLEVPRSYDALYAAAPLAYYLGADVTASENPALRAGGTRRALPREPDALAGELGELLRHCFTLDCATRACSAGLYDVELDVHRSLTERVDPPWSEWYDLSLAERTAAYLEVSRADTLDLLEWPFATDVVAAPENAAILPYLAADLSTVRSPPRTTGETGTTAGDGGVREGTGSLDEFVRRRVEAGETTRAPPTTAEDGVRASRTTQNAADERDTLVTLADAEAIAQAWVGPGFPTGAAKPTLDALRRRHGTAPAEDLTVGVTLVCNDDAMREEVGDTYGFRDHLVFDVREEHDLTTAELRTLLAEDHDFLHYVGHVDHRGVECADGFLDLRTPETTGVEAFLLNACTSYRQGTALVEAGARGGVVSIVELPNSLATEVGRDLARLFDAGFPLYAALDVVGTGPFTGNAYSVVGDPLVQLCQCATGVPMVVEAVGLDGGDLRVQPVVYPTRHFGVGSMSSVVFDSSGGQSISSGRLSTVSLPVDALDEKLDFGRAVVKIAGSLYWTDETDLGSVIDSTDPQSL